MAGGHGDYTRPCLCYSSCQLHHYGPFHGSCEDIHHCHYSHHHCCSCLTAFTGQSWQAVIRREVSMNAARSSSISPQPCVWPLRQWAFGNWAQSAICRSSCMLVIPMSLFRSSLQLTCWPITSFKLSRVMGAILASVRTLCRLEKASLVHHFSCIVLWNYFQLINQISQLDAGKGSICLLCTRRRCAWQQKASPAYTHAV